MEGEPLNSTGSLLPSWAFSPSSHIRPCSSTTPCSKYCKIFHIKQKAPSSFLTSGQQDHQLCPEIFLTCSAYLSLILWMETCFLACPQSPFTLSLVLSLHFRFCWLFPPLATKYDWVFLISKCIHWIDSCFKLESSDQIFFLAWYKQNNKLHERMTFQILDTRQHKIIIP